MKYGYAEEEEIGREEEARASEVCRLLLAISEVVGNDEIPVSFGTGVSLFI